MNDRKIKSQLITTTIICSCYLLFTFFSYHIEKHTLIFSLLHYLLFLIMSFIVFVFLIKGVIQIVNNAKSFTFYLCLPTIICIISLLYSIFSVGRLTSEILESKIVYSGCWLDDRRNLVIKFREDKSFEIENNKEHSHLGYWRQNRDTLFLKFDVEYNAWILLTDTLIISHDANGDGFLVPSQDIMKNGEIGSRFSPHFFLGDCSLEVGY